MTDHAPRLVFHFPDEKGGHEWLQFNAPNEVIVAHSVSEVRDALKAVQNGVNLGQWAAGFVGYDAAPAFDSALTVRAGGKLPLLWFGLFDAPTTAAPTDTSGPFQCTDWQPSLTRDAHRDGIAAIYDAIAAGDVYQVNYTLRMHAEFNGDPRGFFDHLRRAQHPCYAADIDLGRYRILSASPELFFRRDGNTITTRPMKGTRPRGRWPDEDAQMAQDLQTAVKDRAENVMIVDLLRNDLGRIAHFGSVHVRDLFQVERYPTVWQMTSTVEATLDATVTVEDIFAALFPCGSVTGAPKVSAMREIARLEDSPRGVYCGAIGYIPPNGNSVFSVAIRTLTLDTETHAAEYGIGGGITWDSVADSEYDEALSKANLLSAELPAFSLLETMVLSYGDYRLYNRHVNRLLASANYFGFPVFRAAVDAALQAHAEKYPIGDLRVRILVAGDGEITVEHTVLGGFTTGPLPVVLADTPVSSKDIFLFHKTTHRAVYNHHRAAHTDVFDVLLWNERGELTEFTIGNFVLERDDQWWTPPIACGLLAGTFRAGMIDAGKVKERILTREDLETATKLWHINSVHGWVEVKLEGS